MPYCDAKLSTFLTTGTARFALGARRVLVGFERIKRGSSGTETAQQGRDGRSDSYPRGLGENMLNYGRVLHQTRFKIRGEFR